MKMKSKTIRRKKARSTEKIQENKNNNKKIYTKDDIIRMFHVNRKSSRS